jgi:hypothetical protein
MKMASTAPRATCGLKFSFTMAACIVSNRINGIRQKRKKREAMLKQPNPCHKRGAS